MDALGRVVGFSNHSSYWGDTTAWIWEPALGTRSLRDHSAAVANAINDVGEIAGGIGIRRAARFDLVTGECVVLGTFGGEHSEATDVNDAGHRIGWALTPLYEPKPFLWTPELGMRPLALGSARALNDRGEILGFSQAGRAVLLEPDGSLVDLAHEVNGLGPFEIVRLEDLDDAGWIGGQVRHSASGALRGLLRPAYSRGAPAGA